MNTSISITYAINSTDESILLQNQQNLQSSINNQMQKPFVENSSKKINNNNSNGSNVTDSSYNQGRINVSQILFNKRQQKL
ncbi:MAG: hypothetical protein ACTHKJ_08505 [Candidatus Nitrosocosmicus sp.]